ncbi:hypothetical protein D3C71_2000770 [compost metagenome]
MVKTCRRECGVEASSGILDSASDVPKNNLERGEGLFAQKRQYQVAVKLLSALIRRNIVDRERLKDDVDQFTFEPGILCFLSRKLRSL